MHFLSILFRHQWLIVAFTLMVAGNFADVVDIAVHDTYFVIDGFQVGLLGTLFFGVLWALHAFIPACRTVKWLSVFHLIATSIIGIWLWLLLLFPEPVPDPAPKRYYDYSVYAEFSQPTGMDQATMLSLLVMIFAALQAIFLVQVGVWIVRRTQKYS